jgi:RNA polymerase-binding transcription factor DksA
MAGEKKKQPSKAASKSTAKETTRRSAPKPKVDWQVFTQQMEQYLLKLKTEMIDKLIAGNNDFKEIVEGMDPKDFADIASDDIDRKMIEIIGAQELRQLKLIESALTRISQGKYGYCIKCEKRIPPDRLEALPYALMCVECKSEEERRNR